MKILSTYLFLILLLISCNRENDQRIVYNNQTISEDQENSENSTADNYKKILADLPFSFDSLEYLYFPIGETNESYKMNIRSVAKSFNRGSSKSYSLGYIKENSARCDLNNLLIRPKNSSTFKLLTKADLKIKSINYLYRIDTLHNIDKFIYRIIDADSNKDTFINNDDLVALYSSNINGNNLQRISPKNEQLINWETKDVPGLLYFRTMEDIDNNGEFNDKDRINLYEYDLVKGDSAKLIFNNEIYQSIKNEI